MKKCEEAVVAEETDKHSFDTAAALQTAGVVCWGRSLVVSLRDDVLRFGGS